MKRFYLLFVGLLLIGGTMGSQLYASGEILPGRFSISATRQVQFSRGNLQYDYATPGNPWKFAQHQYEVIGEGLIDPADLSKSTNYGVGVEGYAGKLDLFSWSCESVPYGISTSNNDADFTGAFMDWGVLFGRDWRTLSKSEFEYMLNRRDASNRPLWTLIAIKMGEMETDTLRGAMLMPDDWEQPEGTSLQYGYTNNHKFFDDPLPENVFTVAEWEVFEAANAVFLPAGGSRVGGIGNMWNGDKPATFTNPDNGYYFWVDNTGWFGYYWLTDQDQRAAYGHCASYLILPGWSEGPTEADDDDLLYGPMVWSREKRRGNSVRLVYEETATVRDGLSGGKWGTLCPAQTVENASGASFYRIAYLEEVGGQPNSMIFDEIDGNTLFAGQPYFFIANDSEIRGVKTGEVLSAAGESVNGLYGYIGAEPLALPWRADYDVNEDNTFGIYGNQIVRINGATNLRSERCYININATEPSRAAVAASPARRRIAMGVQNSNVATGAEEIQGDKNQAAKMLINGELFILSGEKLYDATGRLVK